MFSRIVSCHNTNEVPITILQACMSLPRHIRKGVLIGQNIASHLCWQQLVATCRQFRKDSRKRQRKIMCKRN